MTRFNSIGGYERYVASVHKYQLVDDLLEDGCWFNVAGYDEKKLLRKKREEIIVLHHNQYMTKEGREWIETHKSF